MTVSPTATMYPAELHDIPWSDRFGHGYTGDRRLRYLALMGVDRAVAI